MHVGRCLINEPRPGNQRLVTSEHLHVATCYTDIMAILIYGWHAVQRSSNTLRNTTLHLTILRIKLVNIARGSMIGKILSHKITHYPRSYT